MHPPPPLPVPHIVPTDVDVDRMPATRQDAANNAEGSLVSDDGDESAWEALDAISDHRTEPTSSSDVRPARILSQEAKVETSRRDLAWDWRLRASSRSRPDYFAAPTSAVPSAKRRRPDLNVGFDKASASVGPESVPVDPLRHAADSYVTRWTRLVEEERDYQELAARKIFLERRRRGEVGVQVEAKTLVGLAVAGYHQQTESEFGTTSKAAFLRLESATGNELSPCEFRIGDYVLLSRDDSGPRPDHLSSDAPLVKAQVAAIRRYHVILRLDATADVPEAETLRLDYGWDGSSFDRMLKALRLLREDPQVTEKVLHRDALKGASMTVAGTSLRGAILDSPFARSEKVASLAGTLAFDTTSAVFTSDQLIHSWAKRYTRPLPIVLPGDPDLGLNAMQTRAVAMVLTSRLSLVQGPPGTGKTSVIVGLVKLLKQHFQVPHQIAVCAPTNIAIDNLVAGMAEEGLKPVRIGDSLRISKAAQCFSLEAREQSHRLTPTIEENSTRLERLVSDLDALEHRWRRAGSSEPSQGTKRKALVDGLKADYLRSLHRLHRMKMNRRDDILARSDVVCCTCLGAGSAALKDVEFSAVVVDEAAQCHEPTTLVPIVKGSAHVSLVGDHAQLPAITLSAKASAEGYGASLFERLKIAGSTPSILLNQQYRMRPDISRFPNNAFYGASLVDMPGSEDESPWRSSFDAAGADGRPRAVAFVSHDFPERRHAETIVNEKEADLVMDVVRDLLRQNPALTAAHIGIISPYAGQVRHLRRLQKVPQRGALLAGVRPEDFLNIEINTVDGYQGREKAIIIFSSVRSNAEGQIGFLADVRRFNVAATRAKERFIVCGNADTLRKARTGSSPLGKHADPAAWRAWMRWVDEEGLLVSHQANHA